jgi:tetratricopeptide (TPR) repeat protein
MSVAFLSAADLLAASVADRYTAVETAISRGDLEAARQEVEAIAQDDFVDAINLYYKSRLESDAASCEEFLQRSLSLCEHDCGRMAAELADLYFRLGRYTDAVAVCDDYRDQADADIHGLRLLWFGAASYAKLGDFGSADDEFRAVDDVFERTQFAGWGTIGSASASALRGDVAKATKTIAPVVSSGGEVSAAALYLKSYIAAGRGDKENALVGYNLLNERFGSFLGDAELADLILSQTGSQSSGKAESLASIVYTIEMGLYGDRSEAELLMGKLNTGGWSADMQSKVIGDKRYWLVRAGVYGSQESASRDKEKLERLFPGNYRVAIR